MYIYSVPAAGAVQNLLPSDRYLLATVSHPPHHARAQRTAMYFTTIISLATATIGAIAAPVARDDTSILDQATKVLDQLNDDLQDITLGIST